jgi:hypothetical protein
MPYEEGRPHIADTHNDRVGLALCGERIGGAVPDHVNEHGVTVRRLAPDEFCFLTSAASGCPHCCALLARVRGRP